MAAFVAGRSETLVMVSPVIKTNAGKPFRFAASIALARKAGVLPLPVLTPAETKKTGFPAFRSSLVAPSPAIGGVCKPS